MKNSLRNTSEGACVGMNDSVPFEIYEGTAGEGGVLILCEHASNHIPAKYNNLGLTPAQQTAHIAWDPHALDLAHRVAARLGADVFAGTVSRLVYDCNRPPSAVGAVTAHSEDIQIPGNTGLSAAERQERVDTVYTPFSEALRDHIDSRKPSALVTMHSFTPVYLGAVRSVELGILHDADARLADAMLRQNATLHRVERNAPYGPADGVTHSLIEHGLKNEIQNVMIEVRNDLMPDLHHLEVMSDTLSKMLIGALKDLGIKAGATE